MSTNSKLTFGDFYTVMWNLVPSVWRNNDDDYGKSLQLVVYTMAQHMYYYFYSRVIHMDELFDPYKCPEKYLRFLAGMVGWTLQGTDVNSWREQINAAPLLYKLKGTKRGLLLAEKLVGYSIFMSELYRDHIGDIVPKEKIFNNTPESVKVKPWFRKALTSLEGELLPGFAESDQFESYNETSMVRLDSFGNVIRPRILTNVRTLLFNPSSTTSRYVNTTGKFSLARYAKLPRINVVLRYEHDLGSQNSDGSVKNHNFSSALDLLLQFKPFHVMIQGLEVRYDLSEFVLDQATVNSDIFNIQEDLSNIALFNMGRAENTITYSETAAVDSTVFSEALPNQSDNQGLITSVYKKIDLSIFDNRIESSLSTMSALSFPIKAFQTGNSVDKVLPAIHENTIYVANDLKHTISDTSLVFNAVNNTIRKAFGYFTELDLAYLQQDKELSITGTVSNSINTFIIENSTSTEITVKAVPYSPMISEVAPASTITVAIPAVNPQNPIAYTLNNDIIALRQNINSTVKNTVIKPTLPSIISNVGHTVLSYDLLSTVTDPILDFKTMLSTQQDKIAFNEQPVSIIYKYIYGGVATFKTNKMTLISVPGEPITIGQHVSALDGQFRTTVSALYSLPGTENQVGAVYTLADESGFTSVPSGNISFVTYEPDAGSFSKIASSDYSPGLDSSNITGISISTQPYRSSVTTTLGLTSDTQQLVIPTYLNPTPLSRPWDLQGIKAFFEGPLNGLPQFSSELDVFKQVYKDGILIVLELTAEDISYLLPENPLVGYVEEGYVTINGSFVVLDKNTDYYFDNKDKKIFLNSAAIASNMVMPPITYDFLLGCKLHILYLSRTTYSNSTENGIPTRGFRYVSRINKKFSRQFAVSTIKELPPESIMSTERVSVSLAYGGIQQETALGIKKFKVNTDIYNRSSLKSQVVSNSNVVSRSELNRTDSSKWKVYSPEYAPYYLKDQIITNNWWGNYYEVTSTMNGGGIASFNNDTMTLLTVPTVGSIAIGQHIFINGNAAGSYITALISGSLNAINSVYRLSASCGIVSSANISTNVLIPYSEIDRSAAGQAEHVISNQWLSALKMYNPSDPSQFLVTRTVDSNREKIWSRSSCKTASVPFVQGKRNSLQVFRHEVPTFSRAEESSDYLVDSSVPPRIDNYKYVLSDGTDVSLSYFAPGFPDSLLPIPVTESGIGTKAILSQTGYDLSLSSSDIYYDDASFGVEQSKYFTAPVSGKYSIKTSLYAGNIPVNLATNTGISEKLDTLSMLVTGLRLVVDRFAITDSSVTVYSLSVPNVWVSWYSSTTGGLIAFGYYPSIPYTTDAFPDIKVSLNGILQQYGKTKGWVFNTGTTKSISVSMLTPLNVGDVLRVEFQEILGQPEDITPVSPLAPRSISHVVTGPNTALDTDLYTIKRGNRLTINLPNTGTVPYVSWYSSTTSEYINSGTTPIEYQPLALFEEAAPNISVSLNSTLINYKTDWTFLLKMENSIPVASIAISPEISASLQASDVILIEYFSQN